MNFLCLLTWRVEHQFAGRKIQTSWEASLPPHVASGASVCREEDKDIMKSISRSILSHTRIQPSWSLNQEGTHNKNLSSARFTSNKAGGLNWPTKLFLVIHVGLWGQESRQKEWWASQLSTSHLHYINYYVICHFLRNLPSQETVTSKPVYVGHGVWAMNAKFHCPLFRSLRFFLAYHRTYGSQYGGHKVIAMSTKLKCLHILNFWCLTF